MEVKFNESVPSVMVSVIMITFNHDAFISQAIEGVLMQRTNFQFELIIADDASSDNNPKIINEFANKYPNIIKPIFRYKNRGSKNNWLDAFNKCTGKYIALCEGDDYWTDESKLQKQVDFLEKNTDYSLCCHRYSILGTSANSYKKDYCANLFTDNIPGIEVNLDVYFKCWLTKTLTVVFRRDCFDINIATKYKYFRDVHLFYHVLLNGKGYCFNFDGGIYRIHDGGVHSSLDVLKKTRMNFEILRELFFFNKSNILKKDVIRSLSSYIDVFILHNSKAILKKETYLLIIQLFIWSRNMVLFLTKLLKLMYYPIKYQVKTTYKVLYYVIICFFSYSLNI